nr:carbohydrate binding domain-containing protein [uncultured Pseudomonas sp.]
MGSSIKSVVKLVTAPIKALYDPVGAFKDVFGGVQGIFAGLTGAAKVSGASSSEPSSQTVRSSKAPVRFILGRASTGGVLAWVQEEPGDQTSGEWLHIVYVLSEGAIAGVDEIYVDERPLSELGANATSEVIINPTQVNAFLLEKCPDWRQEQIGRGLSFVRLSFKYDAEKFPSGIPDVRFVVRGRNDVYDPRNGAMVYSANTALLILWYLRNRCAIPDDEIIFESFANAANVCDETVIGPDSKYTPRYFAGAVIGADEKRNTVLDNLLSACAGTLIRVGGRWSLQVGAYYGPADFTINEDMVIGTVEGTTEVSNSDAINTMRGTFVDPAQAWAETDYPEVAIQDWITADGGELAESQSFAYVTDAYLAQRLANISLRRRRSGGSVSMPLNFNGYNCRPGRAVKVDLPSLNILGEFMVTEWTMGAADACKVTLKPYEQAIFDDAVGQPYDPLGFINLPVGGLAAVTGLAWAPSGVAEVIQGVLSWTPPLQTVLSYTVTIRRGTEVVQSLKVGGEASGCNINGLTSGVYAMSVIAFGPGTRSGEASISVNVGGPPVPESCAVFASVDSITLVPANLQHSLNGGTYEYFYATNPSAPIADAVYLGQGLTFTHTGLAFAKEYFYYVRSANAYGKSDFLFVPAATSSDPTQMLEVIAGQITESELGKELTSRIDLIDMNGPGSVNDRVGVVRSDLTQQITEVNNSVASVSDSLTETRNELQQQISAVDQNVEAAKSSLAQQIAAVDQQVGVAKTDLQQQINTVSVLAGSLPYNKDKTYSATQSVLGDNGMLYQALKAVPKNTPPPNATYWTDVGQAIVTAAGTATRVSKVETDVSTLDGKTTAQASQIGGLQTGLTATNQNVATAQQAADAANTLAGGKGKVIIQAAAPAAVDRLAQNLWIDTTGNANTPKRWSGSAWVAVTDKAATDAAAAAASALALAQTKADAMAVNNLTLRVSDAEGKLVAEGQRLDGLQASLDGKASSTALQEVTSRVTVAERDIVSTSSRTSALENTVNSTTSGLPSKASTAALNSVSGRVTATEQGLSSQAASVNSLTASVKAANSAGGNIVPNASFDPAYSQMGYVVLATASADVPAGCPFKYAARLASRDHYPALADVPFAAVKPGDTWRVSALVACVTGVAPFNLYIQVGTDPVTIKATGTGGGRVNPTSTWTRTSWEYTVPAGVFFIRPFLQIEQVANGGTIWVATDWHMEDVSAAKAAQVTADATATALSSTQATVTQQGDKLVAEGKRIDGLKVDVDSKASSAIVQSLTQRVTEAENKNGAQDQQISSQSASLLALTDTVAGKASSSALQEVTSRVTVAERDIVSTSSRTSALENTVNSTTSGLPSKASTAALSSVSGRVTATEQGLNSQAESVNSLTASVKAANSAGGNIVPNASFDPAYSQMGYGVLATTGADVPAGCPFKYAARLSSRDHYPALADVPFVPVKPGDIWRVSALVACVSGTAPFHLYIQVGTDPATIKGTGLGGGRVNTTSVWTRTSWDYTVPADVFFIRPFLQIEQVANGGTVWLATDWHMEDVSAAKTAQATADATATALSSTQATVTQQGEKLVAEGKRIDGLRVDVDSKASSSIVQSLTQRVTATEGKNGTQDQQISSQSAALLALTDTVAGKANASTVQALSNAVTQQGQDLTAAGAQLTNISASLSDAGSENLIYNPSFEKPGSAAGVADGWGYTAAGGTRNPSLPASTLAPGGVVQRIDLTGLSSSVWFRLRTATDKNVKVASGSTYTLSFYVRATAGLDVKAQINGLTSAGAASGTWQTNLSGATGEWRRLSVTFTPADTTVEVYLAVVVYGTASTSAGFIEVDNAQFERGTIPTGWRDNNSVTDAAQSATAAAVDSLTATVSQQAGALSSVSGRTTNLENSLTTTNGNVDKAQQAAQAASDLAGSKGKVLVQTAAPAAADRQVQNLWIDTTGNANTPKRWNGTSWAAVTDKVATDAAAAAQSALAEVAKKADATAVQALSSRVTANEQGLTSAAESVTNLGASIKAANSAGGNVIPNATFDPAFTRMGFTVLATTASGVPAGCPFKYAAQLTGRDHNPALADVPFVAVKPGDVWRLNALVACAAGTASFNLYIQIGSDPGTVSRTGTSGGRLAPTSTWTRTTFDYTVPAGVYFIRPFLQIDQAAGAGTVWYATDWHMEDVSAAKAAQVTADATAAALSSTQATVAQQGNKLTAETSRIDGLYASVGDANAAIQNEANARANADSALTQQIQTTQSSLGDTNASVQQISKAQTDLKGKVDTSYTVKLQAFAGGIYAAAGIALGIEKNGAVLQSTFAVMADKFAVLNATANGFVSPFSIQYGQVFLTDAFIRDGSIINAKIQDAAIDNAKIANGAITAAKIGVAEIDTLRIRGNAVTVPVSASSAGIVYGVGEGQWRDLIAIGVQMDEAGYITAQYSCYQGFGSGIRKYQFRMEINGLLIAEGGGDWADGFPNLMGSIGVGAGYFVITVKWWGENAGVSVKNHTLYAMGTKR